MKILKEFINFIIRTFKIVLSLKYPFKTTNIERQQISDETIDCKMKNLSLFLKEYGYLIYFGISVWICTPYGIASICWWLGLIIIFILTKIAAKAWDKDKDIYGDIQYRFNKDFVKKYGWCFFLGVLTALYVPTISIKWLIIDIPTLFLGIFKLKYMKKI